MREPIQYSFGIVMGLSVLFFVTCFFFFFVVFFWRFSGNRRSLSVENFATIRSFRILFIFVIILTQCLLLHPIITGDVVYVSGGGGKSFSKELFSSDFVLLLSQMVPSFALLLYFISVNEIGASTKLTPFELLLFSLLYLLFILVFFSNDFLSFIVIIEATSLIFYAFAAVRARSPNGIVQVNRSTVIYLLHGIVGSLGMIAGFLIIWLSTGTILFADLFDLLDFFTPATYFGLFLVVCNLLYKLGAFPFHGWVVPLYKSVTDPIFFFMAFFTKPAYLVLFLIKLPILSTGLSTVLCFVGLASIFVGAMGGLREENIRGLVGYSSIANIGLPIVILGVSGGEITFAIVYTIFYSLLTWFFLLNLSRYRYLGGGNVVKYVSHLRCSIGFNVRDDIWFIISVYALIGIPPLLGFFMKFYFVLGVVLGGGGFYTFFIVFLSLILTTISGFYYLRLVKEVLLSYGQFVRKEPILIYVASSGYFLKFLRWSGFLLLFLFPLILLLI